MVLLGNIVVCNGLHGRRRHKLGDINDSYPLHRMHFTILQFCPGTPPTLPMWLDDDYQVPRV